MKKKSLKKCMALVLMTLFLSVSVFGKTQEPSSKENVDAEGTESFSVNGEEGEEDFDPDKLVDENASLRIAAEEAAPVEMTEGQTSSDGKSAKDEEKSSASEKSAKEDEKTSADKKSAKEDENTEKKDIMVLFTSDIHCGVNEGFGLDGLYEIRESLEKQGYETILVDDGDATQGETIGILSKGEAVIDLMNDLDYDVAIPGNHEYDYGMERFFELVDKAEFPYISCNFTKEGKLVFDSYLIKEVGDVKIGFVGVTTPETISSSTPKYFQNEKGEFIYGFLQDETGEKLYAAVQKAVDDVRAEGADLVYLIAHLGNQQSAHPWNYADVISNTTGIDVVMDGHSHDTDQIVMKNKDGKEVVRSAVGTKLSAIGYSHISAEGEIKETDIWTWNNSQALPSLLGIDNTVSRKIAEKEEEIEKLVGKEIGRTTVDLTIYDPTEKDSKGKPIRMVRRAETNMGDFIADALREQGNTDIGITNGGGVRDIIKKGAITMNDILRVMPFNNDICIVEVTGQQILDALEWGAQDVPKQFGGFLQVSGLSYEIHTYIDSPCIKDKNDMCEKIEGERRVRNVKVGEEALDPEKTYTVCGAVFTLIDKGDGFTMFEGAKVITNSFKIDNQLIVDFINDKGGVVGDEYADLCGDGRIVLIDEEPEN